MPSSRHESERQTRKRRIDPRLKARGWSVVAAEEPRTLLPEAIEEYETANGPAEAGSRYPATGVRAP